MNIGFIGLGAMGQCIVPRLLNAGHKVTGWNRNRDKCAPLVALGMREAATPREAARAADIVFSSVIDAQAVRAVALGENGIIAGLPKGSIYLDMSTIGPDSSRAIAQAFAAAGLTMLDAPISGSPITVRQGKASIMVGGDLAAFERVKPVLLDIGAKATYIGASGFAAQMKLAINQLLIIEVIAFGEAVALAEKGGVPREIAVEAILASVAASPVLGYRGPFILEGQDARGADRRRPEAAEGHPACTGRSAPPRFTRAACRGGQRDDEPVPWPRSRPLRFRDRTRSLPTPGWPVDLIHIGCPCAVKAATVARGGGLRAGQD